MIERVKRVRADVAEVRSELPRTGRPQSNRKHIDTMPDKAGAPRFRLARGWHTNDDVILP